MTRSISCVVILFAGSMLLQFSPAVTAGRTDGPLTTVSTVPADTSVFYDIHFAAGEPAIVTMTGSGTSMMFVMIHDFDGHVAVGRGTFDRKTASMDVYRAGVFRVEVRNVGSRNNTFTLTTN